MKKLILLLAVLPTFFLMSCEDEDDNKIAQAQECLDNLRGSTNAQPCIDLVNGINKPEAHVIRCSGLFILGGLTATKMLAAYDGYENAPNALKEETLIVGLSQTDDTVAAATLNACQKTGVSNLVWIAALSRIGTLMEVGSGSADPATAADACAAGGDCNGNTCNNAIAGQMVNTAYQSYCLGDSKKSELCTKMNTAITGGGGNNATIGQLLYCALELQ